jgi:restriction system protein
MSIPSYQKFMLPLLNHVKDGKDYQMRNIYGPIADQLDIPQGERTELLPSGTQQVYKNRIGWAKSYLVKAGLLQSPKRGSFHITEKGKELLESGITAITADFLMQYEGFAEFHRGRQNQDNDDSSLSKEPATPQEIIEHAIEEINQSLAADLLEALKTTSPNFFEHVVVELLVNMGYGGSLKEAGAVVGKSGDEGIDGIIKEDKLGLDVIYIQAKRWENVVSRPEIQKFVGALHGKRARKGVFITTSTFSKHAIDYSSQIENKVILIDGEQLSSLMIEYEIGVSRENTYVVRKLDSDYFLEE